jgi:hypothetical protein
MCRWGRQGQITYRTTCVPVFGGFDRVALDPGGSNSRTLNSILMGARQQTDYKIEVSMRKRQNCLCDFHSFYARERRNIRQ